MWDVYIKKDADKIKWNIKQVTKTRVAETLHLKTSNFKLYLTADSSYGSPLPDN